MNEIDHAILAAKLRHHDTYAQGAIDYLIEWLQQYPEELLAIARGRYVIGHIRWGDSNWASLSTDDLVAEASEELADGIAYIARKLWLENQPPA